MEENKNKHGRPNIWSSVEDFNKKASGFFDWCKENDYIPDIEGLAVYLDTTRKTILDYEKKDGFSYTIKKLKDKIFHNKKQMAMKNKMNPTVFIFDAKNNHDYTDKKELDHTSGGERINITPIEWTNGDKDS